MLTGADGIQLIEVHQQIVRQRHLLVELVREVQVVQIILTQCRWQQAMEEGGLAASLSANQRGYALIAVKRIHLQPVGHSRAQPGGEIALLLGGDAWQSAEQLADVILSVPAGQCVQIVADRIMYGYIFRVYKLQDFRLRTPFLAYLLLLGPADDAVQGLLGQRTPVVWRVVPSRLTVLAGLFRGELHLSVQHVAAETVVFVEKLLDSERCLEGSIHSSPIDKIFLTHRENYF